MTQLYLNTLNFSVNYFIDAHFIYSYKDSDGRFDDVRFCNYLSASVKQDYLKLQANLENSMEVKHTLKKAKKMLEHINELEGYAKNFNRNNFDQHADFSVFIAENLHLTNDHITNQGEYTYLCVVLLTLFHIKAGELKSDLEDLIAEYEEKAAGHTGHLENYYTSASYDNFDITYQVVDSSEINSSEKEESTIDEILDILKNRQKKREKLLWENADLLFALFMVLVDLKIIISADGKTRPDNIHLAEIIHDNFNVKVNKGKGFFTLQSLEKYFSRTNTEHKKYSNKEKYIKEISKALQSVK